VTAGWGSFGDLVQDHRADAMAHGSVLTRGGGPEAQVVSLEDAAEDNAARLISAGYRPGAVLDAASRAQELSLEIAEEQRRIERAAATSRHWMNMFQQGRIDAWQLQELQPADEGDAARLARLQGQLAALQRSAAEAGGAVASATRMAAQMTAGSDWQAERAQRMELAEGERLAQRAAENTEWFRGYMRQHHERELARAQSRGPAASCPQCAELGATQAESARICAHRAQRTPGGTGWPAERGEVVRTARDAFAVSA
jgi:hypothetical protein